jgi:hypothetical protein
VVVVLLTLVVQVVELVHQLAVQVQLLVVMVVLEL